MACGRTGRLGEIALREGQLKEAGRRRVRKKNSSSRRRQGGNYGKGAKKLRTTKRRRSGRRGETEVNTKFKEMGRDQGWRNLMMREDICLAKKNQRMSRLGKIYESEGRTKRGGEISHL